MTGNTRKVKAKVSPPPAPAAPSASVRGPNFKFKKGDRVIYMGGSFKSAIGEIVEDFPHYPLPGLILWKVDFPSYNFYRNVPESELALIEISECTLEAKEKSGTKVIFPDGHFKIVPDLTVNHNTELFLENKEWRVYAITPDNQENYTHIAYVLSRRGEE